MLLRLALAQLDPCVGDLAANAALVLDACAQAAGHGAQLVVTPELALTGAPLRDLALRRSVVDASGAAVRRLAADLAAAGLGELVVVVGYLGETERIDELVPPLPQNCAAVLTGGQVVASYAKERLPKDGPLPEKNILTRGRQDVLLDAGGARVLLAIGDDVVHENGPLSRAREHGAHLVAALGGTPFDLGGAPARRALLQRRAEVAQAPLAFVNLVGATDDVVFDGGSCVLTPAGAPLAQAARFAPDLVVVDLDVPDGAAPAGAGGSVEVVAVAVPRHPGVSLPASSPADPGDGPDEVWAALRLGLRDFAVKSGQPRAVVGLSGGTDSAVVATLAADALGAANVTGLLATTASTPPDALDDARSLARALGIGLREVVIGGEAARLAAALGLDDSAAASMHYRLRGALLMELAASLDALALSTTNKSELALGAATPFGDAAGDFAPLRDVPRSLVDALAVWRNQEARGAGLPAPLPARALARQPSSHTRRRRDDLPPLPPYPVIDPIIEMCLQGRSSRVELLAAGFATQDVDAVLARLDRAEPLRRITPPGPRIDTQWYGREPQVPIASRWREAERTDQP